MAATEDFITLGRTGQAVLRAGGILALAGAAMLMWQPVAATLCYCLGIAAFSSMQMLERYEGRDFVIRRLRRQQLLGCVALLISAACMAMQTFDFGPARHGEWIVAMAIGCVLELYTVLRISHELDHDR